MRAALTHRPGDVAAPAKPLIAARALSVRRDGKPVLSGVDLAIAPGEIVTIVGPNGSGKTTLLKALLGALQPASGRVERRAGLRLGYVPQKLVLDASLPMSVDRFMALPRRSPPADVAWALAEVGAQGLERRSLSSLSGGQMQRVLLARALLGRPHILLLDEPTQGLDQMGSAAFYRLVERVRTDTGCAVLMVSHELHVVMSASDRVICLNGHVCCHGTPEVVAQAEEYRALFGPGTGGALALYRHEHDHSHEAGGQGHAQGHPHPDPAPGRT
jgi:zinc transport system ATP-binding protein